MADIFDVIADPTRRDLLVALRDRQAVSAGAVGDGEMGVGELVEKLSLSQPTVSKHLKVLREANLVTVREVGQRRYYAINSGPLSAVDDFLETFRGYPGDAAGVISALDHADESLAVFAAWSGGHLPEPLRRAAESLEHSEEAGTAIGRAVADASFRTRSALDGAASGVRERVIAPLAKRIGK